MPASTSIRIEQSLYDAKVEATIEHRTIAGQIACWGKVGTASRPPWQPYRNHHPSRRYPFIDPTIPAGAGIP